MTLLELAQQGSCVLEGRDSWSPADSEFLERTTRPVITALGSDPIERDCPAGDGVLRLGSMVIDGHSLVGSGSSERGEASVDVWQHDQWYTLAIDDHYLHRNDIRCRIADVMVDHNTHLLENISSEGTGVCYELGSSFSPYGTPSREWRERTLIDHLFRLPVGYPNSLSIYDIDACDSGGWQRIRMRLPQYANRSQTEQTLWNLMGRYHANCLAALPREIVERLLITRYPTGRAEDGGA